jgi:hypothetical protein
MIITNITNSFLIRYIIIYIVSVDWSFIDKRNIIFTRIMGKLGISFDLVNWLHILIIIAVIESIRGTIGGYIFYFFIGDRVVISWSITAVGADLRVVRICKRIILVYDLRSYWLAVVLLREIDY